MPIARTHGRGRVAPLDWIMLALAVISVGLLAWVTFAAVPYETQLLVFRIDIGFCAVFALEFLWRWRKNGWKRGFFLRNWYEILGMIPVSHPALRGFRLIRLVIVLMRLGRVADRTFGEYFTHRLVVRVSNAVVKAIKKPVTVAVLDEVADVLRTGHYTQNVARALRENQSEISSMVLEKLRNDPQAGRFSSLPFYDDLVCSISDTVLRVVLEVLTDRRTDELVADTLRENLEQIRLAVRNNEHSTNRSPMDPEPVR